MRRRPQVSHSGSIERLRLEEIGIGFIDLDEAGEGIDAEVGEGHDAFLTRAVDPDQAVLLIHFVGDVPQPIFVFAEHRRDTGDGVDVMDLVDVGQGQAAAAVIVGVQFHGSSSSIR